MSIEQKFLSALQNGNVEEAKSAIEKGADVHKKGSNGRSAIDYAKKYEQEAILVYLESLEK